MDLSDYTRADRDSLVRYINEYVYPLAISTLTEFVENENFFETHGVELLSIEQAIAKAPSFSRVYHRDRCFLLAGMMLPMDQIPLHMNCGSVLIRGILLWRLANNK